MSVPLKNSIQTNSFLITSCFVLIIISLSTFNLVRYRKKTNNSVPGINTLSKPLSTSKILLDRRKYLVGLIENYPTYYDGWVELYKTEKKLGNTTSAQIAIERAYSIFPNSGKL